MPLDVLRNKVTKAGFKIDEISGRQIHLTETRDGNGRLINKRTIRHKVRFWFNQNSNLVKSMLLL